MKQFYELQKRDTAISTRERSLTEVRAGLEDDSAVVGARADLEELTKRLADKSDRRRELDVELKTIAEKLSALDERLYSGSVKSTKEFSASQEERQFVQEQQKDGEDELLELMVEIEDGETARGTKTEALEGMKSDRAEEVVKLQEDERELSAQLAELTEGRTELAAQAQPAILALYEALRKSRDGVAVGKVERGMCQGCRVALTTSELQRVRTSEAVVQCSSCGRILYAG